MPRVKKEATAQVTTPDVEPVKKRRGRPPGSSSKKVVVTEPEPHISASGKRTVKYLNNADMLKAVIESKKQGKMSDTLARMLMMLVKRYASKANFASYTYNDEMQSYALLSLTRTWASFKEDRSSNCFAYYTQCVKNSFIQYLQSEKKNQKMRDELMIESGYLPSYSYQLDYASKHHHQHDDYYGGDDDRHAVSDYVPDRESKTRATRAIESQFDKMDAVVDEFDEDVLPDEGENFEPTSMIEDLFVSDLRDDD